MKKLAAPVVIGVLALLSLALLDRNCSSDKALAQAKRDYEALKAWAADEADAAHAALVQAEARIVAQDEIILDKSASISLKNAEIAELRRQLTTAVSEEPIQPELESEPLVINLRRQIRLTTDMLTLAQGVVEDQRKQLAAWEAKFDAQVEISAAWKRQYENERALRVAAEEMFGLAEKRIKSAKTWRSAAIVAGAVAAGVIIAK